MSFRPQREIFLRSLAFARHDGHGFVTFAPLAPLREKIRLSVAAIGLSLIYSWSSIGSMPTISTRNLYKKLVSGSV